MSGELTIDGTLTADQVVRQAALIQDIAARVMKDGEHYGRIPGCGDKPALLKAGAEKLMLTFGLHAELEVAQADFEHGHREYRITATVRTNNGAMVAQGIGICSTLEAKYRWRKGERKCPECGKAAIIKGKADYGGGWLCFSKKGGCGFKWPDGATEIESQSAERSENPDIADTYNTVLKMAKKRAMVDGAITACAASDFFTQDIEELQDKFETQPAPAQAEHQPAAARPTPAPAAPPAGAKPITATFVKPAAATTAAKPSATASPTAATTAATTQPGAGKGKADCEAAFHRLCGEKGILGTSATRICTAVWKAILPFEQRYDALDGALLDAQDVLRAVGDKVGGNLLQNLIDDERFAGAKPTPHQANAFLAALRRLATGEVGPNDPVEHAAVGRADEPPF